LKYYLQHLEGLLKNDEESVFILTDCHQSKRAYQEILASDLIQLAQPGQQPARQFVLTLNEFVQMNKKEYPELINFAGFMGDDEVVQSDIDFLSENGSEIGNKQRTQIYEEHLSFEEMMMGIKEGRFFQGRFNVSRLVQTEASVAVSGLNQDILIPNLLDQNRALNGDIVCIELLPEENWIDNYKSTEPVNALLDDAQEVDKISMGSKDEEAEDKIVNLVELVNSQESKQVTGKVRGTLKKLNKTYGGSIIKQADMLPSTLQKYNQFLENHNITSKELIDQYRVFVPYNVQLPQSIMRVLNPQALEDKRIIVRFQNWLPTSPFPIGQFVKIVGEEGKLATETNMILHEFNVDMRPFSQRVLACLPKEGKDWQISTEEAAKRWDLRHLSVCSVDPPGCKDIDDALHCIRLPNGNF
jgi:exosome complex exonuclease DIS3/RRP44